MLKYGKALPDRVRSGGGFPVYGSNGVVGYHYEPLTIGPVIVVGRKGSVGEVNFSDGPCSPIDTTYFIDEFSYSNPRFLFYLLRTLRLADLNKSTAIPGLNREDAYQISVPLAPLNEQKRIADKLDAVLARVDACRERLDRVPTILKRFRQSVLAAATSGKLTEDWRAERVARMEPQPESGNTARDSAQLSYSMAAANEPSTYQPSNEGATVPLRQAVSSTKTGPFGSSLHKSDYVTGGIPVVNPMHIRKGVIVATTDMTVSTETRDRLAEFCMAVGDVVIGRRGEMGRCAVVTATEAGWLCGTGSMVLTPATGLTSHYLQLFLASPATVSALESASVGSTMVNLNQNILLSLEIRFPSVEEQTEIVRRVESLFAYADRLEARYAAARAQVDKLTPATLSKAFRGELVPQDPSDEPASALLARITATRAAASSAPTPRKKKRPPKETV